MARNTGDYKKISNRISIEAAERLAEIEAETRISQAQLLDFALRLLAEHYDANGRRIDFSKINA